MFGHLCRLKMLPKKRIRVGVDKIQEAVTEVIQRGIFVRSGAKIFNVVKSHLHRLVVKA